MPKSNVETWLAMSADFAEAELTEDIARNVKTRLAEGRNPETVRVLRGNLWLTITVSQEPPAAA